MGAMTPEELYKKAGDKIDPGIFAQILEMDDEDETREFSRAIVLGFFEQADETDRQLQDKIKEKDLPALSSLGHFLKGSSATLGLTKVKDSCEQIQHLGAKADEHGVELKEDEALDKIKKIIPIMTGDLKEVEDLLKEFYPPE